MRYVPVEQRFERCIERIPWSGCWIWTGCVNSTGYGTICVDRKMKNTHRLSWELHRGKVPENMLVLHRCDIPSCVNPNHLYIGDQKQNLNDGQTKGRVYRQPTDMCKHGHPAVIGNVYFNSGHRYCLVCRRESRKRKKDVR